MLPLLTTLADVRKHGGEDDRRRGDPRPTAPHTCSAGGRRSRTVPGVYDDDGRESPHPTRDGHEAAGAWGSAARVLVAPPASAEVRVDRSAPLRAMSAP
mmetsp:Transcript_15761/g.42747  ORF Transcript_15761/g.42747 Transcript_15761/m.42747 type:complete len:99 (+) Transcript_15761:249-545(+)